MKCDACPVESDRVCPGEAAGNSLCDRPEYRALFRVLSAETEETRTTREARQRELLPRVAACPHRGTVLPVSMQPEGCGCGELTECRVGKGRVPGRVALQDCLRCVSDESVVSQDH